MSRVVEWDLSAAPEGGDERAETRAEFGTPRTAQGAGTDAAPGRRSPGTGPTGGTTCGGERSSEGDADGAGEGLVASVAAPRPHVRTVAELMRRL